MYPKATIHGMDLSPIQPDWIPENVSFVVDDIEHEAGWTYQDDCFDFIYMRHTVPFIRDRPDLWERIYQFVQATFPAPKFAPKYLPSFPQTSETWGMGRNFRISIRCCLR
jgi:hypothetical protein